MVTAADTEMAWITNMLKILIMTIKQLGREPYMKLLMTKDMHRENLNKAKAFGI